MKDLSLKELRAGFESGQISYESLLELLKTDQRKGLIQLIESIRKQRAHAKAQLAHYQQMIQLENSLRAQGFAYIAGLDEVGRGPLAGPVVTAAVMLDPEQPIYGLRDSKRLSAKVREALAQEIKAKALGYRIHTHSPETIDQINILAATKASMLQAIAQLDPEPDHLLVDALTLDTDLPQTAVVKGDDHCLCIAAASVIAKVYRDELMVQYHQQYPIYGFERNMGYGTAEHMAAIRRHGPSPIHRRSFLGNLL